MADRSASKTAAARGRRASRKEEYAVQRRVVELLTRHLDPGRAFFTAIENQPRNPVAAFFQRLRGVRSGLPDLAIIDHGRPIFLELKSKRGVPSASQRAVAEELKQAGAAWYVARSVNAVMVALRREGVVLKHWRPPGRLAPWEGPFDDPWARLPSHPEVLAARREASARWRARQRTREAARLAEPSVLANRIPQLVPGDARRP